VDPEAAVRAAPEVERAAVERDPFAHPGRPGILLDATVIRALIVPAVISLMGRWNWWLPSWPARLLRVESSPLTPVRESA
jgi:hypothetical protein